MQQKSKIKVVVIGGGNGSAIVLNGLKRYADKLELSAVISMSDSGGSTGRLRKEFGVLPPSDIMRTVVAMSKYDFCTLRQVFYKNRFHDLGKLDRHNLGNLFVTFVAEYAGDFVSAIRALEQSLEAVGHAYPVTLETNDTCVELTNGEIVRTDEAIDQPKYDRSLKIKRMWLEPDVRVNQEAERVILEADHIIFSPGSLYTSIIATILPAGVRAALEKSRANLYYIAGNKYQLDGETGPEDISGMVRALEGYLPRPLDYILHNDYRLTKAQKKLYADKHWGILQADYENLPQHPVIAKDFEKDEGGLSAEKLGEVLHHIITKGVPVEEIQGPAHSVIASPDVRRGVAIP